MDKLYSKHSLIIKAVLCFLLSPLYSIFSYLIDIENGFLYIVFSILPVACLYTIPFWMSLSFIKKHRVEKIGQYVIKDFVSVLTPSFLGVLTSEIIQILINGKTASDGIVTVMLALIFVLVSATFWFFYYIFSYKKKNRP